MKDSTTKSRIGVMACLVVNQIEKSSAKKVRNLYVYDFANKKLNVYAGLGSKESFESKTEIGVSNNQMNINFEFNEVRPIYAKDSKTRESKLGKENIIGFKKIYKAPMSNIYTAEPFYYA